MLKKLLFFLFFINFYSYSQDINIDIKKSKIIQESKKHTFLEFSDNDGNGGLVTVKSIFTGMMHLKGYKIDHYDSNLKLIKTFFLKHKSRVYITNIFIKDDILHLIQFKKDVKTKNTIYYVASSSLSDFNFTFKELYTFNRKKYKEFYFEMNSSVIISKNKNIFVLNFELKNKKQELHLFLMYDNNLNNIYQTTFKSDINKHFKLNYIDIDDNNNIYVLGKVYKNNIIKMKKKGKANYHFELYKLNKNYNKNVIINNPEKFISSLFLKHNNDKLNLVGFYSEKNDNHFKGVCRFNLTDNLIINNTSFQPFSKQFFNDKYNKGNNIKKSKKELKNLEIRSLFLDEEDNIIINAEEFYISNYAVTNQFGSSGQTVYHYDDIISVKIDKEGKIIWSRNINKAQINQNNGSFSSIVIGGINYIFINTSDKITKMSNNRISFKKTSAKKSNLYVIKINSKGDLVYKKLIDNKDSIVFYKVINGIVNFDTNSIIFNGINKKAHQILKLSIN